MQINIEETIDQLSAYEAGEMKNMDKAMLKDNLIDLLQQLNEENIYEGLRYELVMITVPKDGELPQPYQTMSFSSPLTKEKRHLLIKEILGLKRNNKGELIVEVLAKRLKST